MMMTLRVEGLDSLMDPSMIGPSISEGRRLQRGAPILDIDGEPNALAAVALHQRVAILFQRGLKLLEREPIGWLAALLLRSHEIVIDRHPFGGLVWLLRTRRGLSEELARRRGDDGRLVFLILAVLHWTGKGAGARRRSLRHRRTRLGSGSDGRSPGRWGWGDA